MERAGSAGYRRDNESLAICLAIALVVVVLTVGVWPGWQVMQTWLSALFT
jgi:hypothetical protein